MLPQHREAGTNRLKFEGLEQRTLMAGDFFSGLLGGGILDNSRLKGAISTETQASIRTGDLKISAEQQGSASVSASAKDVAVNGTGNLQLDIHTPIDDVVDRIVDRLESIDVSETVDRAKAIVERLGERAETIVDKVFSRIEDLRTEATSIVHDALESVHDAVSSIELQTQQQLAISANVLDAVMAEFEVDASTHASTESIRANLQASLHGAVSA